MSYLVACADLRCRAKAEAELTKICENILSLLDSHLIPNANSGESKVFYLKMKGDYHRYLAEFKMGAERKEAAENTLMAYKSAQVGLPFPPLLSFARTSISSCMLLIMFLVSKILLCSNS